MIPASVLGALILGIPLLVLAWVFLHRQRPVFYFAVVLILVGLGYQITTGASEDIAHMVLGAPEPVAAPAAQPAN
ncbi:MAG: hypothetical protein KDJ47_14510 [Hyphomicrobiaceae bacterium]|nr:hypothetical protein [Hyphomicrobiaceae bacterium]